MATKLDKELTIVQLENQIKNILAMSGGISQSIKAFKATYAVLQSLAPDEFPLQWDVIFFSIYSRNLILELSSLIIEKAEVEEVLWREKDSCQPFHHIYILTQKAKRSIESPFYSDYTKPYFSDFIVWTMLEPKFVIYWSYLLEMYTYQGMNEEEKDLPFLALLENEKDKVKKTQLPKLRKLRSKLCQCLHELKISELSIVKPSYADKNNLYIFMPFELDKTKGEKFVNFYMNGRHNKYVTVQNCEGNDESNLLRVIIDPNGITDIYGYINLTREEIKEEQSRFNVTLEKFGLLADHYSRQLYERIPKGTEHGNLAYHRIKEEADKRRDFLNNIPEQLKQNVIDRAKLLLLILDEFYELAQWRYDDIINMLTKLAKVSQVAPINLFFDNIDLKGYLNDICVNQQTMIGFEFSDEFRNSFEEEFDYKMPSDSLHHIHHFVQPGEALKAIYNHKEECLLQGGPIIGKY